MIEAAYGVVVAAGLSLTGRSGPPCRESLILPLMRTLMLATLALVALFHARGVEAQQQCGATAELTWTQPMTNTNGTPLTDLAGFRVYWGPPDAVNNSAYLPNPLQRQYTIRNLCAGNYWTFVTAVNALGDESGASNIGLKLAAATVNQPTAPTAPSPVTVGGPVYTLLITANTSFRAQVGTVAAGVPCNATQQWATSDGSLMLVDRARVTPLAGVQIEAAWTACR
jgi:hypothetical protein